MKTNYTILNIIIFLFSLFNLQQYAQTNYSLQFDGIDDYCRTTQVASVSNNFTMELWAKPLREINSHPEGVINPTNNPPWINFAIHAPHGDYNWGAGHTGVGIEIGTNGVNVFEHADAFTSSSLVWISPGSINDWTHIAVVYENKQPRLYINGTLVRTGVTSTKDYVHPGIGYDGHPTFPNSGFGNINGVETFLGYLDEIRISNIVRYTSDFIPLIEYVNDVNTIGLFHFNEGSGIKAYDESSLNNDGTIHGAIWSTDVPALTNYSLQFDGIDDYVEIPDDPTLELTTNFTLEMIVKVHTQSVKHNSLLSKNPNNGWGSGWELAYGQYNGNMFSFFGSPNGTNNTCALDFHHSIFENWYHLAAVYDGSEMRIYVNGIMAPRGSIPSSGLMAANALPVVLGRRSAIGGNTHFFDGQIYSVKLSNTSRYTSNFEPPLIFENDPNTVALYYINEGSGSTIFDQSGNGNDGTIYGASWNLDYPYELSSLLVLSSPLGGENWVAGTTELITWASTNNVENIKIDYSTNNGSTWINVVTSTPSAAGSYSWTIPNTPASECLVKITDASNSELYDITNLTFEITGGNLPNLVAYYPFNGNANDESGNGYDGVNYGATLTTDRFGNLNSAFSFDGADDYIDLLNTENLNFSSGGFSLAVWVNYTQNKEMVFLAKHIYQHLAGYGLNTYPPPKIGFYLHMDVGKGIATTESYNDGNWHFVVGTYTGSIMNLYVDGQLKGTLANDYTLFNSTTIKIGKFSSNPNPTFCFNGKMDDIRLFNYELTEAEVLALFQESGGGNIKPVSPEDVLTDNEFWVDIKVGDPAAVSNLFGVSFILNYETAYLDYITSESHSWFGNDLVFYSSNDDGSGEVSIGVSRKSPASGVNGSGVIARVKFTAIASTPHNTQVTFSLSDIQANDPNGAGITLIPLTSNTTILSGLSVWPGDANNDGIVDQADVLPLGLHWSRTGPTRNNASMQWTEQLCAPWTPEAATYADCNGDGVVNQAEVLALGLNWNKTHTLKLANQNISKINPIKYEGELRVSNIEYLENEIVLTINYMGDLEAKKLLGLSYEIKTDNGIELIKIEEGDYFGEDVISYLHKGDDKSGYGIAKKGIDKALNIVEPVSRIHVKMLDGITSGTIELTDVKGMNSIGKDIRIKDSQIKLDRLTSVQPEIKIEFGLKQNYPNPFNPRTKIEYSLSEASNVRLSVYNMLGEEIKVLVDENQSSGIYNVEFNGRELSSGIYLYKLTTDKYTNVKKLILMK